MGAGGALADEEEGCVEVGPLASYAGEGLEPLCTGRTFDDAYDPALQGCAPQSGAAGTNFGLWAVPALALYAAVGAAKLLKISK